MTEYTKTDAKVLLIANMILLLAIFCFYIYILIAMYNTHVAWYQFPIALIIIVISLVYQLSSCKKWRIAYKTAILKR